VRPLVRYERRASKRCRRAPFLPRRAPSGGPMKYWNEPWFKIQRRLFDSSVWEEDPATRIVWLTLLALAQDPANLAHGPGVVIITPGNLRRKAFVSPEQFEHAMERLLSPDPYSRTEPGKSRLEVLENGYAIPAFEEYNDPAAYQRYLDTRRAAGRARAATATRGEKGRFQ